MEEKLTTIADLIGPPTGAEFCRVCHFRKATINHQDGREGALDNTIHVCVVCHFQGLLGAAFPHSDFGLFTMCMNAAHARDAGLIETARRELGGILIGQGKAHDELVAVFGEVVKLIQSEPQIDR